MHVCVYECIVMCVHMPEARAQRVSFLMSRISTLFLEAGSLTGLSIVSLWNHRHSIFFFFNVSLIWGLNSGSHACAAMPSLPLCLAMSYVLLSLVRCPHGHERNLWQLGIALASLFSRSFLLSSSFGIPRRSWGKGGGGGSIVIRFNELFSHLVSGTSSCPKDFVELLLIRKSSNHRASETSCVRVAGGFCYLAENICCLLEGSAAGAGDTMVSRRLMFLPVSVSLTQVHELSIFLFFLRLTLFS